MTKAFYLFFTTFLALVIQVQAENACLNHIKRIEKHENIPKNLLEAIARVESGQYNKETKKVEPWPWTLQAEGKSYYFRTRSEAARQIKNLMAKGISNIDVGCMQINAEHHGHHFPTVDHMLDPLSNVKYAAKFLTSLKNESMQTWSQAVGNYHSRTHQHHHRYKDLVYKKLVTIAQDDQKQAIEDHKKEHQLNGSIGTPLLYPYNRTYGLNRVAAKHQQKRRPSSRITATADKRKALMRLKGLRDIHFMG